jgi:hypothetical protein
LEVKGEEFNVPLFESTQVKFQDREIWVNLLFIPGARTNLLGKDLMPKLGIGIKVAKKIFEISLNLMTAKIRSHNIPQVWTKEGNMGGIQISLIHINLKKTRYRRTDETILHSPRREIDLKPMIKELLKDSLLESCMSPSNTPILPVRKSDRSYWIVQELRAINQIVGSRYPIVPNPYTLLSRIPPSHQWVSVVDLKDAFWACCLGDNSRVIFAFEWEDPQTSRKQCRWTVLPQGFTTLQICSAKF